MSCNCQHNHNHGGPPYDCSHINHVFDPKPPTFYGTWNHLYGHDLTNKVSVSQPGIQSGLYRNSGPLNCSCCGKVTMLTGVKTTAQLILTVHLTYSDSDMNKSIDIIPGNVYTIDYLDEGQLCQCTGLVSNIYKVSQLDEETNIYKINIDCSTQYSHNVVVVKSDQLRGVIKYIPYYGEDTKLDYAWHLFGTTVAFSIVDAVVVDAELDKDHNLVRGVLVHGTLQNASTTNGICIGENSLKHNIILTDATSTGGSILDGIIVNGVVASGDIDGETEEDTGYIVRATVKGTLKHVLAVNTKIQNAFVQSGIGSLLSPVLEGSRVFDATISGEDMVTTGGVTVGNVTFNGTTTGGTAVNGIALGQVEGKDFTIIGGTTTAKEGNELTTVSGIVVGGTIVGGKRVGNAIYNAVVKGGICTRGITTNGITSAEVSMKTIENFIKNKGPIDITNPVIIPGIYLPEGTVKELKWNLQARDNNKVAEQYARDQIRYPLNRFGTDDLVLATNEIDYSRLYHNFGNAVIDEGR